MINAALRSALATPSLHIESSIKVSLSILQLLLLVLCCFYSPLGLKKLQYLLPAVDRSAICEFRICFTACSLVNPQCCRLNCLHLKLVDLDRVKEV